MSRGNNTILNLYYIGNIFYGYTSALIFLSNLEATYFEVLYYIYIYINHIKRNNSKQKNHLFSNLIPNIY